MHEHSFIQAILGNIDNIEKVKAIKLEVGELAGIEPDHLVEHLKEKVDFIVTSTTTPSSVQCTCGFAGPAKIRQRLHDMVIFECPECGQIPKVLEGNNIKITNVTYKD